MVPETGPDPPQRGQVNCGHDVSQHPSSEHLLHRTKESLRQLGQPWYPAGNTKAPACSTAPLPGGRSAPEAPNELPGRCRETPASNQSAPSRTNRAT